MPGARDAAPVEVSVYNLDRNTKYWEYSHTYNDKESSNNTNCVIRPEGGDVFAVYVAPGPDFDFGRHSHVKVNVFVDGWYIRTQYLERDGPRTINITRGRKIDPATNQTVQFSCIVGDVRKPGPHELDGTISVEISAGSMIWRRPRLPKHSRVEETDTFKHGPSEPVNPPRPSRRMFLSTHPRNFRPLRWFFLYADKKYRSGHAPAPLPFAGLGKRSRESEEEYSGGNVKRTRTNGGATTEQVSGREEVAIQQREQIELFPEYNGALYVEVPAYGGLK